MRRTKTEDLALERFYNRYAELKNDTGFVYEIKNQIPKAWLTLDRDIPVHEPKVKITLRLDESVAEFYRAMGQGYQARINRILATYAQMQISKLEEGNANFEDYRRKLRIGIDPDTNDFHGRAQVEGDGE